MAVLNRICHGRHRPVRDVNPKLPYELSDVIDRLLEKRPGRRFASAEDVRQALADVLKSLQSPRPWRRRRLMREFSRHRRPAVAACLLIGLTSLAWTGRSYLVPIHHLASGSEKSTDAKLPEAIKPKTDIPAGAASQMFSTETLALVMATGRPEFADEVSDIEKELKAAERASLPERTSEESARRTWSREFRALLEQIHRIEESFPTGPPAGGAHK